MPRNRYDVIIVGAGPAGIFAALELSKREGLNILMLEKGPDIEKRHCPARELGKGCAHCNPCMLLCGWGGAGAFSDGKLTLSPAVGGWLTELLSEEEVGDLIQRVDETFVRFGAAGPIYGTNTDEVERLEKRAALAGLRLISVPIRHMGTGRSGEVLRAMRDELTARGVEIRTKTKVDTVLTENGRAAGVRTAKGEVIEGQYVVVAPGREGASWLKKVADQLGLSLRRNPVDIGVRVEVPAEVLTPLTDIVYEPKLHYYSRAFDDRVRTFCLPPDQRIICRTHDGLIAVKPIADYQEGDRVLTFDFTQRAFRFVQPQLHTVRKYKGKIYKIKIAGNGVIKSTADHLFFVKKDGEYILKRAEELQVGDLLPIGRDYPLAGLGEGIQFINLVEEFQRVPSIYITNLYVRNTSRLIRKLSRIHHIPMNKITGRPWTEPGTVPYTRFYEIYQQYNLGPDELQGLELGYRGSKTTIPALLPVTHSLAKLWGYFIAEGNYNVRPDKMRWLLAFTASDENVREDIIANFHQVFRNSKYHIVNEEDNHRGTQLFFANKLACVLFEHVFGIGCGASNKCLPRHAFNLPDDKKYSLLSGLFSGDGTISVDGTVAYSTTSPRLAIELAYLLHSLGIPTRYKVEPREFGAHFGSYKANWDLWQIRVRGLRAKQKLLRKLDLTKKQHRDRRDSILAKDDTYGKLVQIPHHIAELDQLKVMHFAITEISTLNYTGEVYDFVIPDTHNFIAGDLPFIVHNCVCPYGEVVAEWAGDVMTVNGHSYTHRRTPNTNFAILVSKRFTEPFKEPIAYGKYIARLANLLSGGIMVQRLGDLRQGRRSTEERLARSIVKPTLKEATPGDLNLVLPYRYVVNILEMLEALDKIAPGVNSRHTLLYGVEVKFYSSRLHLTKSLETEVENLFAAGDGAGITRSLVQASASGLVVAREIGQRIGNR